MERIFAENLLRIRKARGFKTQEAIAEAADLPFRTYQDAERGAHLPRPAARAKLAAALRVDEAALFLDPDLRVKPTPEAALEVLAEFVHNSGVKNESPIERELFGLFSALNEPERATVLATLRGMVGVSDAKKDRA